MREIKQHELKISINGENKTKAVFISQLHPLKSLFVFKRVLVLFGPTIADFVEQAMNRGESVLELKMTEIGQIINAKKAVTEFFNSLDEKELEDTTNLLLACVDDGKGNKLSNENDIIKKLDFKQYMILLKEVFLYNFLDFLPDAAG